VTFVMAVNGVYKFVLCFGLFHYHAGGVRGRVGWIDCRPQPSRMAFMLCSAMFST
jgi:hypothetical protein